MEKEEKMKESKKKDIKYVKGMSYHLKLHSKELPFVVEENSFDSIDKSNKILESFVRELEKKFDVIWYMGSDYLGDELYERFMFHRGGFMEISLKGEINCYLMQDKTERLKDAIMCALCKCEKLLDNKKLSQRLRNEKRREELKKQIKVEQKLISIKDSLLKEEGGKK